MRGRIAKIKKTKLLKLSALINFLSALFFVLFTIFYFKIYDLWFFIISMALGIHLLIRGGLFKSDSSVYFGALIFLIGIAGIFINIFDLKFAAAYFLCSASIASIVMVLVFHQLFHLVLAFLFALEALLTMLFLAKIINLTIFLAILAVCALHLSRRIGCIKI